MNAGQALGYLLLNVAGESGVAMNRQNEGGIFPVLKTERLVCRQITKDDAPILHEYWSDQDVTRYFSLEPFKTIEETMEMIALLNNMPGSDQGIRWAVTRAENSRVIGTCGFHNHKPEHFRAEMGYELGRPYWGQGLMTEAIGAILAYGFSTSGFNRVEAFVNNGNKRSTRLLEKNGFHLDGLLRQYEFNRGQFVDQYCYSLLKKDWQSADRR